MTRHWHRLAVLAIAGAATGCSSTSVREDARRIDIAEGAFLELPHADEITGSFDATQVIVASYGDENHSFEAHVQVDPGKITIVGLNSVGVLLFSISYDGRTLKTSGVPATQAIDAKYVLADILLTHWDPEWLNAHLDGAELRVRSKGRTIMRGSEPVIEIDSDTGEPWRGIVTLRHLERGYKLRIENLELIRR